MAKKSNPELRARIIKTAYKCFIEQGYENVTTREIAEYSGISRSHLHYYFNKKEYLLLDILTQIDHKLYIWFYNEFPVHVADSGFLFNYLHIIFGEGKVHKGLEDLSWKLFEDTQLMQEFILALPYFHKTEGVPSIMNYDDVSIFVFYGTISQLAALKNRGLIHINRAEMINLAGRAMYLYRGKTQAEIDEVINGISGYDFPSEIDRFTEYYEKELGWI